MLKSLAARSGLYFVGLTASKILTTLVFIVYARHFGPAFFGKFLLFYTLYVLVTLLADIGLNQWYQKHAHTQDTRHLFHLLLSTRLFTLALSVVVSIIFLILSHSFSFYISILFLVVLIPEALLSIIDGYYLQRGEPFKISVKTALKAFIYLAVIGIFQEKTTLEIVLTGLVFGSLLTLLFIFPWKMLKTFSLAPLPDILKTIRSSSSYAILITTSYAYARADSLIINYLRGSSALGLYGSAYRYLESIALLPMALQHNLFPLSAKKGTITIKSLRKIIFAMSGLGVVVSISLFFSSHFLITGLLGSSFAPAELPLQIFSAVALLFFINSPLATVVQSSDLIKNFLPWGIGNTILNIILNVVFVPVFGFAAASWIMLLTELTGLLINIHFVRKIYRS